MRTYFRNRNLNRNKTKINNKINRDQRKYSGKNWENLLRETTVEKIIIQKVMKVIKKRIRKAEWIKISRLLRKKKKDRTNLSKRPDKVKNRRLEKKGQ